MPGVEMNDFTASDEVRTPANTTIELVKIADGEVGRYTFRPGWSGSGCIKPVVGTESCQVEHVGYMASGTLHVDHEDGTSSDITAGSVYRIAPGHDSHVVGDQSVVVIEFQGARTFAQA
jgi:hypothetical protein